MMLSIIIPAYNAERTIRSTLDSIKTTRCILDKVELIIINDGSTDRTICVIDDWLKKNETLNICILNTENGGVSNARNLGLNKAKGEFVLFVDADDTLSENYLCNVLETLNDKFEFYYTPLIKKDKKQNIKNMDKYVNNQDYIDIENHITGKIVNRNKIEELNLRFNEDINVGEDLLFLHIILENVKEIKKIENTYYHYLENTDSIMSTVSTKTMINNQIKVINELKLNLTNDLMIVEYLMIKNLLVRNVPRIFKLKGISIKDKVKLYEMIIDFMNLEFPEWDKNFYLHKSHYMEEKIGAKGIQYVCSLKDKKNITTKIIKIMYVGLLEGLHGKN